MNNNNIKKPVKPVPVILDDFQKIKMSFKGYRDDMLKLSASGGLLQTAADDAMSHANYGTFGQIHNSLLELIVLGENAAKLIFDAYSIFDIINDHVQTLPSNIDELKTYIAAADAEKNNE